VRVLFRILQGFKSRAKPGVTSMVPSNAVRSTAIKANGMLAPTNWSKQAPKIELAGKYSLPQGFTSGAVTKVKKEEPAEIPIWAQARSKDETAEEKKARKAEVKEHRKQRRSEKRQSQDAVSSVNQNQIRAIKTKDDLNHVTVFKYST
jgi:hypothetical protein